ncbi:tripartite AtP-independent periplasmic transporter subunit DctQ [Mycobacteroides abscessus subsp. abscessus]|nr:tripartite AtP-independent periplasmic transporter subunit DctQ [Mycobacteroides abscessus subsp. abscessus]
MKILNRIEDIFIAMSIMIATLLVIVNVILRVMGSGLTWSEELIRYLLIWVTFVGMSVCSRESEHMSIEFIPQLLKGKSYKLLMAIIYVVAIIFSFMLVWYSYLLVDFSSQTGQKTSGLGINFSIVYLIIPLSGCLLVIRYIQLLVHLFRRKDLLNTPN